MKYKHLFLVWLLADVFLALATFAYLLYNSLSNPYSRVLKNTCTFCGIGVICSLPSLILLLLFNSYLVKKSAKNKDAYVIAILAINLLYLIVTVSYLGLADAGICTLYYIGTTIAGLLALYLVKKFISAHNLSEIAS